MSAVVITLAGCGAVVAFDSIGSIAARRLRFPYANLAAGSLVIYAATGLLAARSVDAWFVGAVAGAAVAAVEATIGWQISRWAGVGGAKNISQGLEIGVTTSVTLFGAVLGAIAGVLGTSI